MGRIFPTPIERGIVTGRVCAKDLSNITFGHSFENPFVD
jgi:hypothetical protein